MTTKIDKHPQSKEIVKLLASGEDYSTILLSFPQLTRFDLDYYRENKLHTVLSKSPELKAEIAGEQGTDTLAEVRALKTRAMAILTAAQAAGDLKTALLGIREARGCLESILKAEGRIQDQTTVNVNTQIINLAESVEWQELKHQIVTILAADYPQALEALRNALQ